MEAEDHPLLDGAVIKVLKLMRFDIPNSEALIDLQIFDGTKIMNDA